MPRLLPWRPSWQHSSARVMAPRTKVKVNLTLLHRRPQHHRYSDHLRMQICQRSHRPRRRRRRRVRERIVNFFPFFFPHTTPAMGKAAKMYKRPTLKQKEAKRKASSSSSSSSSTTTAHASASLQELKEQARREKMLIEQEKKRQEQGEENSSAAPPSKRRSGRAKKRIKVPEGEARTPREAGIDYVAQFEGKKNYRV